MEVYTAFDLSGPMNTGISRVVDDSNAEADGTGVKPGTGVRDTDNSKEALRNQVVQLAKSHVGGKYVYGGTSFKTGIDCSAFVQAIYRQVGISIPRTTTTQWAGLYKKYQVTNPTTETLKKGDLIYYNANNTHVAMYIGNGKICHASNARDGIKISPTWNYTKVYGVLRPIQ